MAQKCQKLEQEVDEELFSPFKYQFISTQTSLSEDTGVIIKVH